MENIVKNIVMLKSRIIFPLVNNNSGKKKPRLNFRDRMGTKYCTILYNALLTVKHDPSSKLSSRKPVIQLGKKHWHEMASNLSKTFFSATLAKKKSVERWFCKIAAKTKLSTRSTKIESIFWKRRKMQQRKKVRSTNKYFILNCIFFSSSTRWVLSTIKLLHCPLTKQWSAVNKSQQHQEKISWERQESNRGALGAKQEIHCAMYLCQDVVKLKILFDRKFFNLLPNYQLYTSTRCSFEDLLLSEFWVFGF